MFLFRDFMSNIREITQKWFQNGSSKKFQICKYEHIIYSFEARDLEISNM